MTDFLISNRCTLPLLWPIYVTSVLFFCYVGHFCRRSQSILCLTGRTSVTHTWLTSRQWCRTSAVNVSSSFTTSTASGERAVLVCVTWGLCVCVRVTLWVCLYVSGRTSGSTYRSRIWSRSLLARGSVIITAFLTTSERTRRPKENSIKDWMWDNLLHGKNRRFSSVFLSSIPGQISKHSKIKIHSKF